MSSSAIEWTDVTWNPTTGCSKVSQGCKHCYAEVMHKRLSGMGQVKYIDPFSEVNWFYSELKRPAEWKTPRMVFVNSMSDLFHAHVPWRFLDAVFSAMMEHDRHIYQVLTKRPEIMAEYIAARQATTPGWKPGDHIWLGVSVEDQPTANERLPILARIEGIKRFVSCEPLLGPVDITNKGINNGYAVPTSQDNEGRGIEWTDPGDGFIGVDWVIVGGESGHGARPMHPHWVQGIRDQCSRAGVPFFFKQWGAWGFVPKGAPGVHAKMQDMYVSTEMGGLYTVGPRGRDYTLWVRPDNTCTPAPNGLPIGAMVRMGKKKAGALLDGALHRDFPFSFSKSMMI